MNPRFTRAIRAGLMATAIGAAISIVRGESASAPLTLDAVIADIRGRHPEIRSAAALAAADRERVTQATAWADPVAGVEAQRMNNRELFRYDALELQLSQKIPLSGNQARRRSLAAAEADVSSATTRTREFTLILAARDAFFRLYLARVQLAALARSEHLLSQAVELVRARIASGATETAALLAAERQRAELQERIEQLRLEASDAATRLNTARDVAPQSEIPELQLPARHFAVSTVEEAQRLALQHRPELGEAAARISAAVRNQDLAARAWRPEPEVMLKARHANASGRAIIDYDTGIALSIPWANSGRYRSQQREAARRREAAELDEAALRTRTAGDVQQAWQQMTTARTNATLYRMSVLPLARQSAESVRAALITGKATLLELTSAQRELVEAEARLAGYEIEAQQYAELLAALCGMEETA
jgi:outer membrane protein TolC